jgi:hypothetical protein
MLDRFPACAHGIGIGVEAFLYRFDDVLMLPAGDAALFAARAFRLERTLSARICPIAMQFRPFSSVA